MAETKRQTGLGPLPAGLLRPTTPPEPAGAGASAAAAAADAVEQGRGEAPPAPRPPRRGGAAAAVRGRKLHLPDELHDRLWLLARQRRTTVSAVAAELLDQALPHWRLERAD